MVQAGMGNYHLLVRVGVIQVNDAQFLRQLVGRRWSDMHRVFSPEIYPLVLCALCAPDLCLGAWG